MKKHATKSKPKPTERQHAEGCRRPSYGSAFSAWQELHLWLINERRIAAERCRRDPEHVGFRGECVALRAVVKKVNTMKWELRGLNEKHLP